MKTSTTIILLGSTPSGLAVARDAWRLDLHCQVVDRVAGPATYSRAASRVAVVASEDGAFELLATCSERPAYLIADSDHWLKFIVRRRSEIAALGIEILHSDNHVLETCLNKVLFKQWCDRASFRTPDLFDASRVEEVRFPVLLRPAETRHRERDLPKAIEIASRPVLEDWLERYRSNRVAPIITESLLGSGTRQYSVGICRRRDRETLCVVAEKVRPVAEKCAGGSFVVETPNEKVESMARALIEAIDFFGIGELEIIEFAGELFAIELNPRPWMQYSLASGKDSFLGFLLNRSKRPRRSRRRVWMDFWGDLYWSFSRSEGLVWGGRLSPQRYAFDVFRANCHPLFDWADPMPWVRAVLKRG